MTDIQSQLLVKKNLKEAVDIRINKLNQEIRGHETKISRLESSAQNDNKIVAEINALYGRIKILKTTRETLEKQIRTLNKEMEEIRKSARSSMEIQKNRNKSHMLNQLFN